MLQTLFTLYLETDHKVQCSKLKVTKPYLCLNLISLNRCLPMNLLLST